MELADQILKLLTSIVVLATAAVRLYTQSTEQKRKGGKKEGPVAEPTDPSTH